MHKNQNTLTYDLRDLYRKYASIPRQEIQFILAHFSQSTRTNIITNDIIKLTENESDLIFTSLEKRLDKIPLAYILGEREFYGRIFSVNSDTLIPRPESEELIELVLKHTQDDTEVANIHFFDIGTGSGNIITTLACELRDYVPQPTFHAIDISQDALTVAKKNAQTHDVSTMINFHKSDLLTDMPSCYMRKCIAETDTTANLKNAHQIVLVANLPYVDSEQKLALLNSIHSNELAHEPELALWSDDGGLAHYTSLLQQTKIIQDDNPNFSVSSFYEIDPDQVDTLSRIIAHTFPGTKPKYHKDLTGRSRVCYFKILPRV